MNHNRSRHHNRTPSRIERAPKRSTTPEIGRRAIGHTSIIWSEPGHNVRLHKTPGEPIFDNPEYFGSIAGEIMANDVLDSVGDNDSSARRYAGEAILQSIDTTIDSPATVGLKRLGASICGADHVYQDYLRIVEDLDGSLDADELRDFIAHVYDWSHEDDVNTEEYTNARMSAISGFRVEASFARLAHSAGFTLEHASSREDHHGIDFYVNGVPFDIKSSEKTARLHTNRHKNNKRRHQSLVFVPQIAVDDFAGRLVIPHENIERILEATHFRQSVDNAIAQYRSVNFLG